MQTLPYSRVVMPFGKIKTWNQLDGSKKVCAHIAVESTFKDTSLGIAIDGSAIMRSAYGYMKSWLGIILPIRFHSNLIEGQIRKISDHLVQFAGVERKTDVIYWSTKSSKSGIELVGELNKNQLAACNFNKPGRFGAPTSLAPAVRYFAEKYIEAKRGVFVFITHGVFDDLPDVKALTFQLARDIVDAKRMPIKLILLAVGDRVDERLMKELIDFDTGTCFDLWDYKIASELDHISEIFTEITSDSLLLAANGLIRDARGRVVKEYSENGLPALLEFILPPDASSAFIFEFGAHIVRQPLL